MVVMTEEDKYAFKELLRGFGAFAGACGVFIIILIVLAHFATGGTDVRNPTSSNAEVVGKYRECDIIQWTQHNLAEYKYFLYCEKNK